MSNARHNALTPQLAIHIRTRTGVMLLYKPLELSFEQAAQELADHLPGSDVVSGSRSTPTALTAHTYGRKLMEEHYEFQIVSDDAELLQRIREASRNKSFPFRPEELLRYWTEGNLLPRKVRKSMNLSDHVVFEIEQMFEHLNREIEYTFTRSGKLNLTGLLHLPPVLGLKGSDTIIGIQQETSSMTPRMRLMLARAAGERLVMLSEHPDMSAWTLRFPTAANPAAL